LAIVSPILISSGERGSTSLDLCVGGGDQLAILVADVIAHIDVERTLTAAQFYHVGFLPLCGH
jgi:hypothetical protein